MGLLAWCDHAITPWAWVAECAPDLEKSLMRALWTVAKQDVEERRRSLYNLASAALEDDFERIGRIATGIIAASRVEA